MSPTTFRRGLTLFVTLSACRLVRVAQEKPCANTRHIRKGSGGVRWVHLFQGRPSAARSLLPLHSRECQNGTADTSLEVRCTVQKRRVAQASPAKRPPGPAPIASTFILQERSGGWIQPRCNVKSRHDTAAPTIFPLLGCRIPTLFHQSVSGSLNRRIA